MPFLTTPTLSRDLPWMDGCPHILHTSIKPQTTHIHNHAESCIFPSDGFFFFFNKDSSQLDLWMGSTARRKREQRPRAEEQGNAVGQRK